MAQQLLEYKVVVDTGTGKVSVDGLTQGFVNADVAAKKLNSTLSTTNKNIGQQASKSGLAGAAVVELARTISDVNYGFTAMANNLSQLATLFITLVATLGGTKEALKSMKQQLMGPLGVIVLLQIGIAAIEGFVKHLEKKKREAKLAEEAQRKLNDRVKVAKTRYDDAAKAVDEYIKKLRALDTAQLESANYSTYHISRLKILLREIRSAAEGSDEQKDALAKLREEYGRFYEGVSDADIISKKANESFKQTEKAIKSNAKELKSLEGYDKVSERLKELNKYLRDNEERFNEQNAVLSAAQKDVDDYSAAIKKGQVSVDGLSLYTDKLSEATQKYGEFVSNYKYNQEELVTLTKEQEKLFEDAGVSLVKLGTKLKEETKGKEKITIEELFGLPPRQELVKTIDYYVDQYKILLDALRKTTAERLVEGEDGKVTSIFESLFKTPEELLSSTPEWEKAKMELLKIPEEEYLKDFELGVEEFLNSAQARDAALFLQQYLSAEARRKLREEEKEHALLMYEAIGDGLTSLADIIGKETAAGKAFAVAGALISTYAAIAGQLEAFSKAPVPGYAIAQAIATGLFGFAQVKKILSVQVPGGGGGGGSAGSMAPAPSPTFNVVGSSGSSQLREAVEKGMEKPVKAYVTQKDINSSAELDRNTRKSATIV